MPSNGLVGWWPFNGNATDESINTNDGTVNGATLTADRFGNANSAYIFDGVNDYIDLSNINLNISGNQDRTIAAWTRTNVNDKCIISSGNSVSGCPNTNNGHTFNMINNPNRLGLMGFNCGTCPTCDFVPNTGQIVTNNQWKLLILRFYNDTIFTFVNGVLDNKFFTGSSVLNTTNNGNYIGKSNNIGSENFYNGYIDDIGIWNRALTPSEITGLYNANLCFQTITVTDTLLINTNLTGFNPVTYQNTIKIWPNPTNDHLTIDNGNLANLTGHQIKISNALGQQVFQSAITQQQFYVDMSTWGGNGIYFVNIINAQGVTIETRKIVLQ